MTQSPIIFCAHEFVESLRQVTPEDEVSAFSDDIKTCQERVAKFDTFNIKKAYILFNGGSSTVQNLPVKDHLNLSNQNPLIGPADLSKGSRFPDMSSVYDGDGNTVAVLGEDTDLINFDESWVQVQGGVWEAIALKHRGYRIEAWIIGDIEKWINETLIIN